MRVSPRRPQRPAAGRGVWAALVVFQLAVPVVPAANSAVAAPAPDSAAVRCVALTFDDGPTRYTPSVLKLLEAHHAVATFSGPTRAARQ
nr:polysaccharide deacetylase family protein [Streptomyces sp. NRRL S-31]